MPARREPANAAALLTARVVGALTALVLVAVSAHQLDVFEFGLVVSTMAAGFLANMFVTFGTDTVIVRAVAGRRDDARGVTLTSLSLQLGLAAMLVAAAFVAVLLGANGLIAIQAMALFPMAVVTVSGAVLRGAQHMGGVLVAAALGAVGTLAVLFIAFEATTEPWVPIAALTVGSSITAAVAAYFAIRLLPRAASVPSVGGLVRETAPFAAMVLLAGVGAQGGLLLVEFFSDESSGGYGVAVRLVESARLLPASAMAAFFPAMLSGLHKTDRYRRWLRMLYAYAGVATLALLILSGPINRIVFNEQPGGAALTRILSLGLIVTVARLALSFELIAVDGERSVLTSAIAGTGVMAVAGVVAARHFGAQGVAWSQLAGLSVSTLVLYFRARTAHTIAP